jgi:hypothetical protein
VLPRRNRFREAPPRPEPGSVEAKLLTLSYGEYLGEGAVVKLDKALVGLRKFALRYWRRQVANSHSSYRKKKLGTSWEHERRDQCVTWLARSAKEQHESEDPVWDPAEDASGSGSHAAVEAGRYVWSQTIMSLKAGRTSYVRWHRNFSGSRENEWTLGRDAIRRANHSTWWNWDEGSQLFFWRWPEFYQERATDGLPVHFHRDFEAYLVRQPDEHDPVTKGKQATKLGKVILRQYICLVDGVPSYTSYFSVPKADDIRMVYDASKSGLNATIWVPRFPLPTIQTHLRAVEPGTWMGDLDIGEMFFKLPASCVPPEGVWSGHVALRFGIEEGGGRGGRTLATAPFGVDADAHGVDLISLRSGTRHVGG